MTEFVDLLPLAHRAVDVAREQLLSGQPGRLTPKADRDMASELDYAIERTLRDLLANETPNIGFLGEEEGSVAGTNGLDWALDPIDGTVNFLHGHPLVCVSLALLDHGRPVLGIVDAPFLKTRFWAVEGHGSHRDGELITASETRHLGEAIVAVGDYAVGKDADEKNVPRLALTGRLASTVQRVRMHGSAAIDFAWLACGTIDALVMLANNTWDVAAGTIIAREAGALVLDIAGRQHDQQATSTVGVASGLRDEFLALVAG
jgi:myo-inositol-1(or 4)-monophosphatase